MIKYYNYDIVFKEIPNEISLAINITNCQNFCDGCHSPHLTNNLGNELNFNVVDDIISKNKGITCFVFMGEGNDINTLISLGKYIKESYKIKIGLYSGRDVVDDFYYKFWDYLKVGHYDKELGGLDKKTTNQRLFYHNTNITHQFWK